MPGVGRPLPAPLPCRVSACIHTAQSLRGAPGAPAQLSPHARRLADLAAVIGRSFAVDLLAQASGVDEMELVRGLDELWKRRIVHERGADYDISHDRIRDVAYAELAPMQRRLFHRRVAQTLEQANAADLDAVSAQLAWHYEHADRRKQAVEYYQRAGMTPSGSMPSTRPSDLFRKGLALLEELPASPHATGKNLRYKWQWQLQCAQKFSRA